MGRRKKREEKRHRKTLEGLQNGNRKTLECLQKGSAENRKALESLQKGSEESTSISQFGCMRAHQQLQNGSSGVDGKEIRKSQSLPPEKTKELLARARCINANVDSKQ